MHARTSNNRVSADVLRAVCRAINRNIKAAKIRAAVAPLAGWLA